MTKVFLNLHNLLELTINSRRIRNNTNYSWSLTTISEATYRRLLLARAFIKLLFILTRSSKMCFQQESTTSLRCAVFSCVKSCLKAQMQLSLQKSSKQLFFCSFVFPEGKLKAQQSYNQSYGAKRNPKLWALF